MFKLKPFQEEAISSLKDKFLYLWKSGDSGINLTFKSPTGSGKTIMMAQFLRDIVSDPRFINQDCAFIWITNSDTLAMQSKDKLQDYYGGASEINLVGMNDMQSGKLSKNSVFFINWQKLVSRAVGNRRLRTEGEQGYTFDQFLENTHEEGRNIVLIIDEVHIASTTVLANDLTQNVIKPRIILGVSATPQNTQFKVDVDRKRVIEEGLIKEKVIFQTKEDLDQKQFKGMDQDKMLLELAYQKREEIVKQYKKLDIKINPLVLIQLPNDDTARTNTQPNSKKDITLNFLKEKNISENDIAVWLSEDKVNLKEVERNESNVSFLLFKQAVATGWDCPRAGVLVMFREVGNPTFLIQTVGRILRMPFGTHFPKPELNMGYLYTNYKRNEILAEDSLINTGNKPAILESKRKESVKPIEVKSVFMSRSDYNDLGDTFQNTFKQVANKYFGISEKDKDIKNRFSKKGLDLKPAVTNGLITGVEIDDYDNFTQELLNEGSSHDQEMSQHDIERLYNLICFNIIAKQTDENKKFAPERSWGKLKTALNVWLSTHLTENREQYYKVILNDLLKENSVLKPIIGQGLEVYRPIRDKEVEKREARKKRDENIEIPRKSLFFTDDYEILKVKKSAMEPFYIEKDPFETERDFINLLEESKNIEWWYKNGDSGSEHFSISYYSDTENKEKLFYPDWIVKTKIKIWIIDTKDGITATDPETKYKAEALQVWLKGKKDFAGGIAVKDVNGWKINSNKDYSYTPVMKGWESLDLR